MKVKYIINEETVTGPKYGKAYDVVSIELGWYRIIDESEEDYIYPPEEFEIIDPSPAPPILTEEDIRHGLGGKYVVIDEYSDMLARGKTPSELDDVPYCEIAEERKTGYASSMKI
jgi:hypothetical protein